MRRLALIFLLGLCGCGASVASVDSQAISPSFALDQATHRPENGLTVRVYNTGSLVVRGGAVSSRKSWTSKTRLDIPAFLIKHPKQGYVLFDTGLHPDMAVDPGKRMGRLNHFFLPFETKRRQDVVSQLAADGISAEQVRWVVISHLHIDHVGMIDAFPQATVLVDRREWQAQKEKQAKKRDQRELDPEALEGKIHLRLVELSSAPSYGAFDHGVDLFHDGTLFLVDVAGHSPGTMGLWASLDEGPVFLAGDASWVLDNHRDLAMPLTFRIFSTLQYQRRLRQMKSLQEAVPRLVIFPGHDLQPLTLQPRRDISLALFPRGADMED